MGDSLLAMLSREGVDVGGLVRTAAGQTSASVIPVRPNGDRPAWHCVGANAAFTRDDLDLDQVIRSSHLHLGGPEFLGGPAAGEPLRYAKDKQSALIVSKEGAIEVPAFTVDVIDTTGCGDAFWPDSYSGASWDATFGKRLAWDAPPRRRLRAESEPTPEHTTSMRSTRSRTSGAAATPTPLKRR